MPENLPSAVAFDVFGTLLRLHDNRNPWKQIAQLSGNASSVEEQGLPLGTHLQPRAILRSHGAISAGTSGRRRDLLLPGRCGQAAPEDLRGHVRTA